MRKISYSSTLSLLLILSISNLHAATLDQSLTNLNRALNLLTRALQTSQPSQPIQMIPVQTPAQRYLPPFRFYSEQLSGDNLEKFNQYRNTVEENFNQLFERLRNQQAPEWQKKQLLSDFIGQSMGVLNQYYEQLLKIQRESTPAVQLIPIPHPSAGPPAPQQESIHQQIRQKEREFNELLQQPLPMFEFYIPDHQLTGERLERFRAYERNKQKDYEEVFLASSLELVESAKGDTETYLNTLNSVIDIIIALKEWIYIELDYLYKYGTLPPPPKSQKKG